jgi:hypothetical protein
LIIKFKKKTIGSDKYLPSLTHQKKWLKKAHENGSDSAEDICGCEF